MSERHVRYLTPWRMKDNCGIYCLPPQPYHNPLRGGSGKGVVLQARLSSWVSLACETRKGDPYLEQANRRSLSRV